MKTAIAALLFIVSANGISARPREWKDATVTAIESRANDNGAAVLPINGALYGVRLRSTTMWYTLDTPEIRYVLGQVLTGRKRPLNITLYGKVKFAIEGSNAHVLDDGGKDVKIAVVRKIAN